MKTMIEIVFPVVFQGELVTFSPSLPWPAALAKTCAQMRQRILREYIAKHEIHVGSDAPCGALPQGHGKKVKRMATIPG